METNIRFHPLSLIATTLVMPVILLLNNTMATVCVFLAIGTFVLLVYGRWQRLIKLLIGCVVALVINWFVSKSQVEFVVMYLGITSFMMSRIMPVMMLGSVLSTDVKPGELISALQQIKIPKGLILSLIVALRFIPIYVKEVGIIKSSLKMRGIRLSPIRPLEALEYTMVPALFRGSAISEEMTASAMTKAIEAPGARTSVYILKTRWIDVVIVAIAALTGVYVMFF